MQEKARKSSGFLAVWITNRLGNDEQNAMSIGGQLPGSAAPSFHRISTLLQQQEYGFRSLAQSGIAGGMSITLVLLRLQVRGRGHHQQEQDAKDDGGPVLANHARTPRFSSSE